MLDQFRMIDIVWDNLNNRINEQVLLVTGGGGRVLRVQVLNQSKVVNTKGLDLHLVWKDNRGHYRGEEKLEAEDVSQGIYKLKPTGHLVKRVGRLTGWLQLSAKNEVPVMSLPFPIQVKKGVD